MSRIALYAGSFDPRHERPSRPGAAGRGLADRAGAGRSALIPARRRCSAPTSGWTCCRRSARRWRVQPAARFDTITFADLVVDAAQREGATLLIRGLRNGTDFDYEMEMAGMNGAMAPEVQTVFLPASPPVRPITATLVRQIASMGGDVTPFRAALRRRPPEGQVRRPRPAIELQGVSMIRLLACSGRAHLRGACRGPEAARRGRSAEHAPARHHAWAGSSSSCGPTLRPSTSSASSSSRAKATTTTCRSIASSQASWRRPAMASAATAPVGRSIRTCRRSSRSSVQARHRRHGARQRSELGEQPVLHHVSPTRSYLNGKYTVVGEVVSGMDAVDKIKKGEPVRDPDRMIKVQVAADAK